MPLDMDPGAAATGNPRLVNAIIEEMDGGAIPFERFMELALYHPEHGYYRQPGRIGPQGDFLTSPRIHAMFGWAVGAWLRWLWGELGQPQPFTVFEPGAGDGYLATAILDWAEGRDREFADALHYVAFETGNRGTDERVTWAEPPVEPAAHGAVISNEFFDALPVRLFDQTARGPQEVYVRWNGESFEESPGPVANIPEAPPEGRFEASTRLFPTMSNLAQLVEQGAVLTFDYGYPREELWAPWRTAGTLLCFYRHTAHENPYIHVGDQDMTAHVDFTELEAALDATGFETHGPVRQSEFLFSLGVLDLVEGARQDLSEYFARRRAMEQLTDGAGLGRVRVLAGLRGVETEPPGFEESDDRGV
ncbi:MAG: SAM-dependent methyltransferase [Dehalococcoidia bacterium]|nr:SAM-dependent methyltransferase [Dehalococcoidia bacterium]